MCKEFPFPCHLPKPSKETVILFLDTLELLSYNQVTVPNVSNACSGFGDSLAWTFFDLNKIYDEHKDDSGTVIQADFVSIISYLFNLSKGSFSQYNSTVITNFSLSKNSFAVSC